MKERDREAQWLLYEKYDGESSAEYYKDVERLDKGEPLGYVIGYVPFLNTTTYLDSHPLIPRPETEYWTEKAIQDIRAHRDSPAVLDLCAGSGCVGVAVLKSFPNIKVDFVEVDEQHHPTILKNLELNGINAKRARVFGGDLFENIDLKYDYILSNPPYIDKKAGTVHSTVAKFEPALALYGGKNGAALIERIIKDAPQHLNKGGKLYLEHEPNHKKLIQVLAKRHSLSVSVHKDQYGTDRYSVFTHL